MTRLSRTVAAICGSFLFTLATGTSATSGQGSEAPRIDRVEPGTKRVRVFVPVGESPLEFRDRVLPGAPMLSERPGPFVDLALGPADLECLRAGGHRYEVLPPEAADSMVLPTLYTFGQVVTELQAFAATYPSIAQYVTFPGSTHDGNAIHMLKVSDDVGLEEDEPTVFFVGVHHGGEMIGADVLMQFLWDTLPSYGTNPTVTQWIDDHEIWVMPIGNPDGWFNNELDVAPGWRKNKRDNNGNGVFDKNFDGVDINRNFDFNWSMNGSGNPGSSTYYGPGPGSEPENQVVQNHLLANKPILVISWHMSGEVVIIPWTWNGQKTPDSPAYLGFAQQVGAAIPKQNGAGTYFAYEEVDTGGYLDDWVYGRTGGFCATVEVSWSAGLGPITDVLDNNRGTFPVVFQRIAGSQVTGHVTDVVSGVPLDAKVEILEIDTSELPDRTSDAAFGRYRWLTRSGTFTLRFSRSGYHAQTIAGVIVPEGAPATVDPQLVPFFSSYGSGLSGSGGQEPVLAGTGTPTPGGTVSLDVANALGGSAGVYLLGLASASIPALGGTILVGPPLVTAAVALTGAPGVPGDGTATLPLTIPANPQLAGVVLYAQALVVDAGAPSGVSFTAGLRTHIESP